MRANLSAAYAAIEIASDVAAAEQRRRELADQYRRNETMEAYLGLSWEARRQMLIGRPGLRIEIGHYTDQKQAHAEIYGHDGDTLNVMG